MPQLFLSRTVVNNILFVEKIWNFTKKVSIIYLTVLVGYIKACPDIIIKTSKYWLLYYQLSKMFSSVEINSEVIETVAQNSSLKKDLLKICKKTHGLESLFFKIRLKEKKGNSNTGVFPRIVLIFFRTLLFKVASR